MYNVKFISLIIVLSIILISCSAEPREIDYGNENCHFCSMTIMDKQFGSESLTQKGKIYTFCSIECMVWDYVREKTHKKEDFKLHLAKDYIDADEFINVEELFFIKSADIPSPMGASLSAYNSEVKAIEMLEGKVGEIYTWKELITKIK